MEHSLSREEKGELVRSKKKVKAVSYAGSNEGHSPGPASPNHAEGSWNPNASFRDKLVGEIPGAFSQAFSFEDGMDDDAESDEEVETLRQGLLSVKFSKEIKQKIHKPWGRAFIVKVYGWNVGFNFIQAKLLALWKPAGRLDYVDLGHGFFLTRLSLGEDYENVLRKGPWFIGDHFLSIKPWVPDFKLVIASVSSIAVWVRFNELPIEYYNVEALQLIGRAIGKVLRVDTFTASETRGRFARICVQVDVEKPLATAIMIGRFEQQICYEGIHNMCFECGQIGHRKEQCPYIIQEDRSKPEVGVEGTGEVVSSSRFSHVTGKPWSEEGTSGIVEQSAEKADAHDGVYGPWLVVERRKNGTRSLKSGGSSPNQSNGFSFKDNGIGDKGNLEQAIGIDGLSREVKRKLPQPNFLDKAQIASMVQNIRSEGQLQAQPSKILMVKRGDSNHTSTRPKSTSVSHRLTSIKGKKGAARNRFSFGEQSSAVGVPSLSSAIVDVLRNADYVNNIISPILEDCRQLLTQFQHVCIKHCFRQANLCADGLARMSCRMSTDFIIYDSLPVDILDVFEGNLNGMFCNKLCPDPCFGA